MRYFLEVAYKGTAYAGFQIQNNAKTIQGEVGKALLTLLRRPIKLTGSSRTDAGVHALQNFFHGDFDQVIDKRALYSLNAILPSDIVIKRFLLVEDNAHCRFDAVSREYHYHIYQFKNPFQVDEGYYFPYKLDIDKLQLAAEVIKGQTNFSSFAKKNTQTKTTTCYIKESQWNLSSDGIVYQVKGTRFLRGMVRALVATMLKVGTSKLSIEEFKIIFNHETHAAVDFAAPPQALFLAGVSYKS